MCHRLGFRGLAERLAIGLALPIESQAVRVVRWCQAVLGLCAGHGGVVRCVKGAERARDWPRWRVRVAGAEPWCARR
jgi:hypothetical protein